MVRFAGMQGVARIVLGMGVAGLLAAAPVRAATARVVDLVLVLAVDVSRSVDYEEFQLQREGYAQALTSPEVLNAIKTGQIGAIAVTYFEWSGFDQQKTIVPWTVVDDLASAEAVASRILEAERPFAGYTSISNAIDYGMVLLEASPHEGLRQVIDISGDGSNNSGRPILLARDEAVAKGITINGLPIVNDRPSPFGRIEINLEDYYKTTVIGGPGAFHVVAQDFQAFGQAIRAKLVKEIAELPAE